MTAFTINLKNTTGHKNVRHHFGEGEATEAEEDEEGDEIGGVMTTLEEAGVVLTLAFEVVVTDELNPPTPPLPMPTAAISPMFIPSGAPPGPTEGFRGTKNAPIKAC